MTADASCGMGAVTAHARLSRDDRHPQNISSLHPTGTTDVCHRFGQSDWYGYCYLRELLPVQGRGRGVARACCVAATTTITTATTRTVDYAGQLVYHDCIDLVSGRYTSWLRYAWLAAGTARHPCIPPRSCSRTTITHSCIHTISSVGRESMRFAVGQSGDELC